MTRNRIKHGPLSRNSEHWTAELRQLLGRITSIAEKATRDEAFNQLLSAIANYKHKFPVLDDKRRKRSSISEDRASLNKLQGALHKCHGALSALSLGALRAFCNSNGPRGKLLREINGAIRSADAALAECRNKSDRQADTAASYLAYNVALILKRTLGIRITTTRDDASTPGTRGGAAYARILRAVFGVAGIEAPVDLMPLMKAGKSLLDTMPE